MSALGEQVLLSNEHGGVLEVQMNRPERLNALSAALKSQLAEAFRNAQRDPSIGAVLLTGAGDRAFAAGQDLREAELFSVEAIGQWIDSFHDLYSAVLECDKPTIAAINGYAVGAAFQLALLCDIRVIASHAKLGMPEIDDGIPCITGTWTLYEAIGRTRTAELILTGRMITADEALQWGLVTEVTSAEQLMPRARLWAQRLAGKPAAAVSLNKARLRSLLERERESGERFAKEAHAKAYATGVPQQKMADFLARRREGRSE